MCYVWSAHSLASRYVLIEYELRGVQKGIVRVGKVLLQDLIVSLFELYAPRSYVRASALVALLGELDIPAGAARSSISRLKGKEILQHASDSEGPKYALSPTVRAQQQWNVQRVFAPERSSIGDPWAMVIFSVPEPNRQDRYMLKRELVDLGFGFVASGVAIAPHSSLAEALFRLEQCELRDYITYFTAEYGETTDLPAKVRQWWDLPSIESKYGEFIEEYSPLLEKFGTHNSSDASEITQAEALGIYVPLYTRWKLFPYLDPNIPLRLLPVGWPAPRAKFIFLQLNDLLAAPAKEAAQQIIDSN